MALPEVQSDAGVSKGQPERSTLSSYVPGRKNDGDKLRYDLIPPDALEELARVYTIGANKYGDHNWLNGIKWSRVFGALMRHAWAWWRGEVRDPQDGQHHLSAVAWNAFALMTYELRGMTEFDDRFKGAPK